MGRNSASPWPMSFSAPGMSSTTRLSARDDVAKASREGTLALMVPVTMSTDGRWVASTRWMPAARASWVMRWIESSTSRGATIMRSASSSTITSRYGYVRDLALGARQRLDLARAHGLVEVVDVLVAEHREVVVARVHLLDDPLERLRGLLGVGDDGRDEVRDALVNRRARRAWGPRAPCAPRWALRASGWT